MAGSLIDFTQDTLRTQIPLSDALVKVADEARRTKCEAHLPEALATVQSWYADQLEVGGTQAPAQKKKTEQSGTCQKPGKCVPARDDLPKRPGVKSAFLGRFADAPVPKPDPMVLELVGVVPGAKLVWVNRSRLDQSWDKDADILPGDTKKHTGDNGYYNIVLGNAWLEKHGIQPGDVLELRQKVGDRLSPPIVVPTNLRPAGATAASGARVAVSLPPGDRIELDEQPKQFLVLEPDRRPPHVMPERVKQALKDGVLTVFGSFALEPGARVVLENAGAAKSEAAVVVQDDGTFSAKIAANAGDPIVIRVLDHSGAAANANALFERRLVLTAGSGSAPVLARNPALGIDGTPQVALGRFKVAPDASGAIHLAGTAAVTEGSLISVSNMSTGATFHTAADAKGNFRLPGDFKLGDVLDISVQNAFSSAPNPHAPSHTMRCETKLRATIADGCALALDSVLSGEPSRIIDGKIEPKPNIDDVTSATPKTTFIRTQPSNLNFSGGNFTLNLGTEVGAVLGDVHLGFHPSAKTTVDEANKRIVITIGAEASGGWIAAGKGSAWLTSQGDKVTADPSGGDKVYDLQIRDTTGEMLARAKATAKRVVSYGSYMPSSRGVSAFYERAPAGWSAPRYESVQVAISDYQSLT